MALAALNGDVSTCAVPRPGDLTNIFQVRGTEYLDALVAFRREGSLPPRLPQRSRERSYAMVASRTALKPGGRTTLRFVLAWYFPNHIDADGNRLGHAYENWFGSAREVVKYAVGNLEKLRRYTFVFHDTLYDTTLDRWVVDLATSQLTTLVKNSFYTRDLRFAVWEGGPGCCGLQTLDVSFYGSIPVVLMFPDLEKAQLRLTASFQLSRDMPQYERYALAFLEAAAEFGRLVAEDPGLLGDDKRRVEAAAEAARRVGRDPEGRIPHSFPGTLSRPNSYHMMDVMPKFALLVYRDYLWTGDRGFLKEMWPHVRDALRCALRSMDHLGRGVPYHYTPSGFEMRRGYTLIPVSYQTFDDWPFLGYSAYVTVIWLAALKAAVEMARVVGDEESAREFGEVLGRARGVLDELWNGEYFDLWYDPVSGLRDRCCMAAQLAGQWYANLCGLGRVVDEGRTRSALRAILKYNIKDDEGVLNGAYPGGPRPAITGNTEYPNGLGVRWKVGAQSDTPWTGVELALASLLIQEGMVKEGLGVARLVHERYSRLGMYWNHIECGGHYYRAMDAWALLMALEGIEYDARRGSLTVDPKVGGGRFRGPLVLPGCWGTIEIVKRQNLMEIIIEIKHGSLDLKEVAVKARVGAKESKIYLNDQMMDASLKVEGASARVSLKIRGLKEGDTLKVRILYS